VERWGKSAGGDIGMPVRLSFWRHSYAVVAVLLAGLLVGVFFPLFQNKTLFYGDNLRLVVPGKLVAAQALAEGRLPWWNPYNLNGQPFLADINQSVLYPTTLLFMWLPPAVSLSVSVLIHLWLTGFLMYWLVTKLFAKTAYGLSAAVVWMLSGSFMWGIHNLSVIQAATWIPLILGAAYTWLRAPTRLNMGAMVVGLCLSVLGGHPQVSLIGGVALVGLVGFTPQVTFRRKFGLMLAGAGITGLLLLPQLLATYELSRLSTRMDLNPREYWDQTFPVTQMLTAILPHLFLEPDKGMVWGPQWNRMPMPPLMVPWVILMGLLLGLRMKKKPVFRWAGLLMLLGLSFSFAGSIPGIQAAGWLPFTAFRNAPLNLFWFHLGLAVITPPALAQVRLQCQRSSLWRLITIAGITCGGLGLVASEWVPRLWARIEPHLEFSFITQARAEVIAGQILADAGLALIALGLCLGLLRRGKKGMVGLVVAIYLAIPFSRAVLVLPYAILPYHNDELILAINARLEPGERVLTYNGYGPWNGLVTYDENVIKRPPFSDSWFDDGEERWGTRLRHMLEARPVNWNAVAGIPSIDGYTALLLRTQALWWDVDGDNGNNVNNPDQVALTDERLGLAGVAYVLADLTPYEGAIPAPLTNYDLVYRRGETALFALDQPAAPVRHLGGEIIETDTFIAGADYLETTLSLASPARIVINSTAYPGWECRVNGEICRLDSEGPFMALDLPAGRQAIKLRFEPQYRWAFAVSGLVGTAFFMYVAYPGKKGANLVQ
jgi:hypothetical protein